jgi:hypothetical protein
MLASSEDGGMRFSRPQSVSANTHDPNHPSFAHGPVGSVLLCFQGRVPSQDGRQWSPTAAFIQELDAKNPRTAIPLANGGQSISYPVAALSQTGSIFVAWTAVGQNENPAIELLRGERR